MIFRNTAICHPLKPSLHSGKRRTIYIIVAIWIFCMIPSAWWLVYGKVRDLNLELQIFMSYEKIFFKNTFESDNVKSYFKTKKFIYE